MKLIAVMINKIMEKQIVSNLDIFEEKFVEHLISQRIKATETGTFESYFHYLFENSVEQAIFRQSLYISFSEFFRNPLTYAILGRLILPEIIQKIRNSQSREIRIWSAACAAGQEAYSVAMLLEELCSSDGNQISYRIFATDVNKNVLAAGENGIFEAPVLANVPHKFIQTWFAETNGRYKVNPRLGEKISFTGYDLLSETECCPPACIYGDFDLVLLSNVLFYYQPDVRNGILNKITRCLRAGGYLITGEAERDLVPKKNYSETYPPSAIFVKKINYERP